MTPLPIRVTHGLRAAEAGDREAAQRILVRRCFSLLNVSGDEGGLELDAKKLLLAHSRVASRSHSLCQLVKPTIRISIHRIMELSLIYSCTSFFKHLV